MFSQGLYQDFPMFLYKQAYNGHTVAMDFREINGDKINEEPNDTVANVPVPMYRRFVDTVLHDWSTPKDTSENHKSTETEIMYI